MNILAIIPARSKSKSIKNKNLRKINGKPLMCYSIEHAITSTYINRIIVSTDSKKYCTVANKYGAETPFLRPDDISGDESTDLEVFQHALKWLKINENYSPDVCVHLRPTYPVRNVEDIDKMIQLLIERPEIDAVRSIVVSKETPFKMWFRRDGGLIFPVVQSQIKDAYNCPRQKLEQTYIQNASIDVIRTSTILEKNSMTGENIYGYLMEHFWDIDELSQLKEARKYLKRNG